MILGIPVISIVVTMFYMVLTVLITEYLKKFLFFVDTRKNKHSVILSWVVGSLLYFLAAWFDIVAFNPVTFVIWVIVTLLLNAAYRFTIVKQWIRNLFRLK